MALIKSLVVMLGSLFAALFANKDQFVSRPADAAKAKGSVYDFQMKPLTGDKPVNLAQFKGKKIVILNVASKCGFTKQYADWEKFYETYGDKVVVLGFPANNFMSQEPGSNEEIAAFCQKNYGVTFPMFDKIDVVGDTQHPLYKWLTTKSLNGWNDKVPTWNFCKYVIDEKGQLLSFGESKITPANPDFIKAIGL